MSPTNFILAVPRQTIIELKGKVPSYRTNPSLRARVRLDVGGQTASCPSSAPRSPRRSRSAPAGAPGPGRLTDPPTAAPPPPLTSPRGEFAARRSAPPDRPPPEAEVGGLPVPQQASAERPPLGGEGVNPFGETRASGRGVPPRNGARPPGDSSNFPGGDVPAPNALRAREAPAAESALPGPAPAPRHPSGTPPAPLRPGPALGAPRPHPVRAPGPSVRTGPDPTPSRAASPHPARPSAASPRHGLRPAGRRPVPASPGPAGSVPRSPCIPPQRATAPGQPRHRKAARSGTPSPEPRAPAALTVSPSRGQACTRRSQDPPPAPRRPETPPSLSPGLAGTAAHGSPHRGYF